MTTYHCPQCDITFLHEDAEAVFCIPGCVCSEDFEMYSPVYRIVKSVSTFLYVCLAFGIFLLVLPFAIMSGPAGLLVFLGILSLLLLPALFSVFRHKGMQKILLLSILAGVISGILLIWVAFLGPLSRVMREVSSATQQQETHP